MSEWQSMTTAPKTGERVIVWSDSHGRDVHARWCTGCPAWFDDRGNIVVRPLYWMPSPKAP